MPNRVYYRDHLGRFVSYKTYRAQQTIPSYINWAGLAAAGLGVGLAYLSYPSPVIRRKHKRRQRDIVGGRVITGEKPGSITCPRGGGYILFKGQQKSKIFGQQS